MSDHIVAAFDFELAILGRKIAEMSKIIETMVAQALDAFLNRDMSLAERIIGDDKRVNALQREIETSAVLMIARRQPMAVDLREIIAAIRISGDLERIGDLSKNIAQRSRDHASSLPLEHIYLGLTNLNQLAAQQLRDVLQAYSTRDADKASLVWQNDSELDMREENLFRQLLDSMVRTPQMISHGTDLLFCTKNLERIGDHVTNIAEIVVYLVTGDSLLIERPKKP